MSRALSLDASPKTSELGSPTLLGLFLFLSLQEDHFPNVLRGPVFLFLVEGFGRAASHTDSAIHTGKRVVDPGGLSTVDLDALRRTFHGADSTEVTFFYHIVKFSRTP